MKKLLFTLLIAYVIVITVNVTANYSSYAAGHEWKTSVLFSLFVTTLGVLGGHLLFPLFRKFNWTKNPTSKIILSVLLFAVYGALLMLAGMKGIIYVFNVPEPRAEAYVTNILFSVLFSMIIGLIISGRQFLIHLKQSTNDNARLRQEMLQSQFETLKSQVNPHFLFNSLNTLTVMIPEQPQIAVQFVEQMARVFRYSLQHSDDNVVALATELKVVRSFLFLNQQRFQDKLNIDIDMDDNTLQQHIITQSLLMLAENAVKHNEISSDCPLTISIRREGAYLVVQNNLQPRTSIAQSTKMGLENIRRRYALLTDMPVTVTETDGQFTVKIPLL